MAKLVIEDLEDKIDLSGIDKSFEDEKKIPSNYIEIKLPSLGAYGAPKSLHFRDYTSADVLDLNMSDESGENICKVLTNICWEKYDISKLSEKDVLVILYVLHNTFVDHVIEKKVYIDDTLEEGDEEGELDNENNIEIVDINLGQLWIQNLGYDKDDNLIQEIKIPFTIVDKNNNDKIKLRIPLMEDTQLATRYSKDYFKDDFIRFSPLKNKISSLQSIKDKNIQREEFEKFYSENEEELEKYYEFMKNVMNFVAKLVQAMQIVEVNGDVCDTLDKKLKYFNDNISSGVWSTYEDFLTKFNFGFIDEIEYYSPSNKKKVTRKIPFSPSDFIPTNKRKSNDRFSIEFD